MKKITFIFTLIFGLSASGQIACKCDKLNESSYGISDTTIKLTETIDVILCGEREIIDDKLLISKLCLKYTGSIDAQISHNEGDYYTINIFDSIIELTQYKFLPHLTYQLILPRAWEKESISIVKDTLTKDIFVKVTKINIYEKTLITQKQLDDIDELYERANSNPMISRRYLLGLLFLAMPNDESRFKMKFLTFDKKFKLTEKENYYYNRLLEMYNSLNDIK